MINVKYTSHVIFLSKQGNSTKFYGEKNSRFDHKITFFGGKLEENETYFQGLVREILEETGLDISKNEYDIIEDEKTLKIDDIYFVGNLYLIYLTQNDISTLLGYNEGKNIEFDVSELNSVDKIDFGIQELKEKLLTVLNTLKNEK